jgi:hypothetical protein
VALSQKQRTNIYARLSPVIGEEEADALLLQFPSREADEPVVKADLAVVTADLAVVKADIGVLRAEMHAEIADLQADMADRFRQQTVWMVTAVFGGITTGTVIAAVAQALG